MEQVFSEDCIQKDNKTNTFPSKCINEQDGTLVTQTVYKSSETISNKEPATTTTAGTVDQRDELNIVLSCVFQQSDLLELEYLVQAGELQYINQTLRNVSERLVDDFHRKRCAFPEFIQNCLTPIMYFLKRLQNLDDFMNTLTFKYQRIQQKTNHQSTETTNLSLRMLLHVLFMSSDIFLRRIIMSLVSKRNPVPLISPNIQNWNPNEQYEFMPAIIHVWDYKRPTILSFGVGPCKGKSTLLNQLFQSTFEQTVNSIYFQQTIDIDFGYCFNPERAINIADTHGIIDKKLLRRIQPLFDGFLIQIDKTNLDRQPKLLLEYVEQLPQEKFQMIIVRDTSSQNIQECSTQIQNLVQTSESELTQKLHIYPLTNISNTNDRNTTFAIEDLREEILKDINEEVRTINEKDDVLHNLQKLMKKDYVDYLRKMDQIIRPLKKRLWQKNEDYNEENFPLYLKFQELCKVRQKLKKLDFYGSESENMFEINAKLFTLESELDPQTKRSRPMKCGYVFDSFMEILKSDNMLMSLDLLASELKSELSSLGGDKLAGSLVVEHAFLSLEVLWRNSVVCYDHTTNEKQDLITKSYHNFVQAGFPFEIIDGDNFHFQHQFLTKILNRFATERILVISIIGPQNSGKSTLLNYMFGTLFDVREGRCTRGIYGSLVKLMKSNQTNKNNLGRLLNSEIPDIDYIMLIDTEGLLSIEKGDKEYDRRLVLFALAVSHLVIVNMMGDINETLKDMLTLCADSLKQIGVNTVNQPIVHFVLNQKADPNLKNHMEAIEKIIEDLKEKGLGEVIDISSKTFHTLPSAFKKERVSTDTMSPCFLRTEPDFIERTQQLCEKIVESAKSSYKRSGDMFSNPAQWLKTAVNIFDTLQKFPDLTYFKDINERRQDDQIRKEIGDLITKTLSAIYREQMIEDTCELTEHEIRKHFQAKFDVHQTNFDNDLENIFKVTTASDRIRDRCRQFLKRQVTEISNAWCTAAIQAHDRKQMEGLVRDGSADLRSLIDEIIKSGKTMSKDEATQEFEIMWKRKIESINNSFNPEVQLKQAIKFVYGNYHIFEKECLPAHEHILNHLPLFTELGRIPKMEDVVTSVRQLFAKDVSILQQSSLEHSRKTLDTNVAYTLTTLNTFKHLNKDILTNLYAAGTIESEASIMEVTNQNETSERKSLRPSKLRQGVNVLTGFLGFGSATTTSNGKSTTTNPTPLRFDFMKHVHKTICKETSTEPNATSNILNIPKLFEKILQDIIAIAHGNNAVRRPIEIDLVQKIVGLINTHINEINLELLVFNLLLSKPIKATIHFYVVILLTMFYYDEQKKHFSQQITTLDEQKQSLLTYFISMVVPDAQCDKEGAALFANQVKNAIQSNLMRDAQKLIARIVQAQQNLNRKEIQKICDGKLQAAAQDAADWLFNYIDKPTDIIIGEFEILWEAVEKTINQQVEKEKNQWKNVLTEFFSRIEFMSNSLANEGSSVQYIDDIFEASGGIAADNLKNKGQCMVLLLYTYLSGNQIKTGTSYTVFNEQYTLKPKGLKLFEKLPLPSQQLVNLVKGIKDVEDSNDNRLAVASIKNLLLFLQSIMDVKNDVESVYDKTPATFAAFDKDQIYNKLLDKARGCTSKCPCCDRPCDVDHSVIKSNAGIVVVANFFT
jgi:GTPase Era involved in 16S rRNA processing